MGFHHLDHLMGGLCVPNTEGRMGKCLHIHSQFHIELVRPSIKPHSHLTAVQADKAIGNLLAKALVKSRSAFPGPRSKEVCGNEHLLNLSPAQKNVVLFPELLGKALNSQPSSTPYQIFSRPNNHPDHLNANLGRLSPVLRNHQSPHLLIKALVPIAQNSERYPQHPPSLPQRQGAGPEKSHCLFFLPLWAVFFLAARNSSTPWISQANLRPSFSQYK